MVSYNTLLQTCAGYTAQNFYVGEVIPAQKLDNARKRYPIPQQERVVALLDTTVFGSAKAGLAIGETGLHWRNANTETRRTYLSWRDLAAVPIVAKGIVSVRVEMGQDAVVELVGAMGKYDVVRLLSDIQHSVRSPSVVSRSSSPAGEDAQWMLAVDGAQYGPYDLETVRGMVEAGRIDPKECLAWRAGMGNWEPFVRVPSLAALLEGTAQSPTVPPPLPTSAPPALAPASSAAEHTRAQADRAQKPARTEVRERTVSEADLLRVCVKYSGDGYYVGESIPQKKLDNARERFSIPETQRVVALLDTTLFGSAKTGLAVAVGGIFWRETLSGPRSLLWTQFASLNIQPKGNNAIEIGDGNEIQPTIALKRGAAVELLTEIQALVRAPAPESPLQTEPRAGVGAAEQRSHRRAQRDGEQAPSLVDLNHAPADNLLSLPGITLANGQRLISERERRGGFDTVEEAGHLLDLPPHQVERLRRRVKIAPYRGERPSSGRVVDF